MDVVLQVVVPAVAAVVASAVASPVAVHLASRRQRDAQTAHLQAQTAVLRQDIYQQITADLAGEVDRLKGELRDARASLAATSAEAERLRVRVVELESRVAQLTGDLGTAEAELDRLRAELAAREATIGVQRSRIAHLEERLAELQTRP